MAAAVAGGARTRRHRPVLVGAGIAYVLGAAMICALRGEARPLVLPSDVLTGWASLLRNTAAFAYRELSDADLRTLDHDPAVLTMDVALTALAAAVDVLVVGGISASIRAEGHLAPRTRILLGTAATLLVAAIATATVSTLDSAAFYGALFRLPVD